MYHVSMYLYLYIPLENVLDVTLEHISCRSAVYNHYMTSNQTNKSFYHNLRMQILSLVESPDDFEPNPKRL